MKYITGIHALNIEDSTDCCGDWHTSGIQWGSPHFNDTDTSLFGTWGIEYNKHIPEHTNTYAVANTLRAILDLLTDPNQLGYLKGFYDDFICTDRYNTEFFTQVLKLRDMPHWDKICNLMEHEFLWDWQRFIKEQGL